MHAAMTALALGAAFSCGSRTGLFEPELGTQEIEDPLLDSGRRDARRDAPDEDVIDLDALPPIDVAPKPDVDRTGCADADETRIAVSSSGSRRRKRRGDERMGKVVAGRPVSWPRNIIAGECGAVAFGGRRF